MRKAQFPGGDQRMKRLAHAGPGNEVREKCFHVILFGSHHTIQIFRDQRGERFADGESHSFLNGLWRPAVEDVPIRSFASLVVDARNAQARPERVQSVVQGRRRDSPAQRLR